MDRFDNATKILLALSLVEELSSKKKLTLLDAFEDVCELVEHKNHSFVEKVLGADKTKEFEEQYEDIDKKIAWLEKNEIHWITYLDEEYPSKLLELYDKPILLFVKGNADALNMRCIAVVGTRRPTRYGSRVAEDFSREFARAGLCVVSGLARGVDGIAHKACVENGSATIAVFASGLDVIYPAEHRGLVDNILANGGAIVSEYPPGTKPLQYHFPERNRIVSGLCEAIFLPQAAKKSGSLITTRLAIEQGKEIFVVPANIYDTESEGGNELLREIPHALAIKPEDVLDALHLEREFVEKEPIELSLVQNQILEALKDGDKHFEDLLEETKLNVSELTNVLFELEIEGLLNKISGNYYSLL